MTKIEQNSFLVPFFKLFLRWNQHDPRPRDASQDLPRADHVHGSNHHPPARWWSKQIKMKMNSKYNIREKTTTRWRHSKTQHRSSCQLDGRPPIDVQRHRAHTGPEEGRDHQPVRHGQGVTHQLLPADWIQTSSPCHVQVTRQKGLKLLQLLQ